MAKARRSWIVTKHGPLQKLDDNLWLVRGDLPGLSKSAGFSRAMHIIKLSDGRLAFHNAVPVDETALIHNNRRGTGFNGFMFRLLGFAGDGPKVPPMYKVRALRDGKALKRDLLRLADTPGLVRLVPSHGSVVSRDPAAALRNAANTFL